MNKLFLHKAEKIKMSDFTVLGELSRLGSLREVSRQMNTTPVQISRRLKVIEKAIGYQIFARSPKGLTLTGQGHELMKSVLAMNGEFHSILSHRKQKKNEIDRPLGIAGTSILTSYAVIPIVCEMMKLFPEQRSYVHAFNPDDLIAGGLKGAFHLAVHPDAMDWPRSWQTELIGHMSWKLYARKGHPLTKSLQNLEEFPFIYPLMWDGTKLVLQDDNCPLPVIKRNSYIGTQTAEQGKHFISQSNLVGFLPQLLMHEDVDRNKVVEVTVPDWPSIQQPIYLSVRTDAVSDSYYKEIKLRLKNLLKR